MRAIWRSWWIISRGRATGIVRTSRFVRSIFSLPSASSRVNTYPGNSGSSVRTLRLCTFVTFTYTGRYRKKP